MKTAFVVFAVAISAVVYSTYWLLSNTRFLYTWAPPLAAILLVSGDSPAPCIGIADDMTHGFRRADAP